MGALQGSDQTCQRKQHQQPGIPGLGIVVSGGNLVFYTAGHSIYIDFLQAEGKAVPGSQSGLLNDNENKLGEKLPQNQL